MKLLGQSLNYMTTKVFMNLGGSYVFYVSVKLNNATDFFRRSDLRGMKTHKSGQVCEERVCSSDGFKKYSI